MKLKISNIVLLGLYLISMTLTAKTAQNGKKISSDLFGLFFEDINYAADGGLYAELIQNRSFEYSPTEQKDWNPLSFWEYFSTGYSYGRISVETSTPIHPNNPHYVVLDVEHIRPGGSVGLKNPGFAGIVVKANDTYNFSMFARQLSQTPASIIVTLQTSKGKVIAEGRLSTSDSNWKKYTTALVPTENCDSANLVFSIVSESKIALDVVSLFPQKIFKNRPNGLRADLAQVLADMKPKFIRFPGGCLAHGDGLGNMYRWKNTIGPVEQRLEQRNIWGYHQTVGLGYFEYFQFCEDIGAKPLPVIPAAVSCQNSGGAYRIGGAGQRALPLEEMPEYIQEVLDLVEWANGPVTSTWGAKRAAAGHPAPFHLQYIGIGNEDKITPEFEERFAMIFNVMKEKHPEITVIGTVGPSSQGEDFDKGWKLARKLNIPIVDEHYYTEPNWFISNQKRYDSYDRKSSEVYLGEYASWGNKMTNALAEAAYMTGLERNGDIVRLASYAPLLAKRNFTQWKTDMIFFDNIHICLTPNYYVQKMFSSNQGDFYFDNVVSKDEQDNTLAASCVKDSKTGDIILKLVNFGTTPGTMNVHLEGFKKMLPQAEKTVLSGNGDDENTFADSQKIVPSKSTFKVSKHFEYSTPAMSLTVIRIKTR